MVPSHSTWCRREQASKRGAYDEEPPARGDRLTPLQERSENRYVTEWGAYWPVLKTTPDMRSVPADKQCYRTDYEWSIGLSNRPDSSSKGPSDGVSE